MPRGGTNDVLTRPSPAEDHVHLIHRTSNTQPPSHVWELADKVSGMLERRDEAVAVATAALLPDEAILRAALDRPHREFLRVSPSAARARAIDSSTGISFAVPASISASRR